MVRRCPRRSLPTHRSPRPSGTARRCFGRSATHAEWHARLSIPTAGIDYWLHGADALPHRGHAAIVHSAFGCSALCDQCLHRGPAAGLRLGHRGTRTYPCQVPGPKACRDVQHRRELAGACFLGHRDDQHRGGAADLASSRARDAEGGAGTAEGDRAATVLCAWSHPGRIHSEAAFAMLAGVASIPANSGQVTTVVGSTVTATASSTTHCTPWSRAGSSTGRATRDCVARRTAEGKTGREIKRCLAVMSGEVVPPCGGESA